MKYLSHTENDIREFNLLKEHLSEVAEYAGKYARNINAGDEAIIAGLLHDLGKYGDKFQARLRNKERGIDHWSAGAWRALKKYEIKGIAIALAIQGHHIGLLSAHNDELRKMDISKLYKGSGATLKLSEEDLNILLKRFEEDGLKLPDKLEHSIFNQQNVSQKPSAEMLGIRMLFSALVDADFIATEAHFNAVEPGKKLFRQEGRNLDASKAMEFLNRYIENLSSNSSSSRVMKEMRTKLRSACVKAAEQPPGLFTLTAPTGSGKTLSMLSFALEHARLHNKERIVVVLPYLSIIEQTARIYREIFANVFGEDFIIENHSLAGKREVEQKDERDLRSKLEYLAENWDAPIVITTSVQLLESLHSNRSSACRKLHRLANSIIMLDEVQTLPLNLALPTLTTLSALSDRFNTTVLLSTATQPAFAHLNEMIKNTLGAEWNPKEIVPEDAGLFDIIKRTRLQRNPSDDKTSWEELAEQLIDEHQALCIVNIKRHAIQLYDLLTNPVSQHSYHLSTNMCPAHRKEVLKNVQQHLKREEPCLLISTQCVEAGVDIDFPSVYRAMAPLDSIAQAAGRCNRNGKADSGKVVVFTPEDNCYPDGAYEQGASVTAMLFNKYGEELSNIENPELFEEYFKTLYSFNKLEDKNKELLEAIKLLNFENTAKEYKLIRANTINVIVPYNTDKTDIYQQLKIEAQSNGVKRDWIKKARPYAVSIYMPRDDDPIRNYLEPAHPDYIKRYKMTDERWFFYTDASHYNDLKGLIPPDDQCIIA
ncbi:MAG: CRISPR-associated helicase Cas3' [candidate division Zixibacteria bacterium]|nr:CRISPR-associated helicase Cas3' [candidate division Zixibacteria bacterium]